MKVLSLFDGIGGARQALKELNIDCKYFASEIDKYAIQVAKANHSDIKHIGDVENLYSVRGDKYCHLCWESQFRQGSSSFTLAFTQGEEEVISEIDLLIGGSPCQDLSIAKKDRKGLEGNRSSLFYEYLRILNETKPKYFILENVASMSKESKEIITKELFNIEPVMINSALLTAQNRKRLYWVGELVDGEYKQVKIEQPKDQEICLKDIIEENVDEKYYISEKALKTYTHNGKIKNLKELDEKSVCLTATTHKGFGNDGCTVLATQLNNSKNWGNAINKTGKAFTLRASQPNGVIIDQNIRKLTPTECCRLQGFPDDYVSMVSNTQGYKGLGNSFTVPVIKHILQKILKS